MSSLLSDVKNVVFGDENKIAKPISDFSGIGFNAPGLGVDTFKGGFNVTRSPETQAALARLSGSFGEQASELGALRPFVSPAFGGLSRVGSQAIEDLRRKTVSDLRTNLSKRKALGSSFAADDISRTNAEFAKQDAQFVAETKLKEIEATAELINQQYEAAGKSAIAILEQGNFESTIGAELSRQYTGALAELAKFESGLLNDQQDGITAAIGAGTTALLGGALGGFGASALLGGGAAGAAGTAGAAAGTAAGFGALGTQIPGVGTVGGVGTAAGLGFAGNLAAKSLPGDQTNIESNIGAIAGTILGAAFLGPVGAIGGGFLGTALGSAINSVFGKTGGGEDKPDYALNAGGPDQTYGTGVSSSGVWGSVGFGHQKHISNTDTYQAAFDNVIEIDKAVSQMFTPEQNAAIAAELGKSHQVAQNSNEGGYTPARAATQIFNDRAQVLERVLGAEAFASTGLKQLYTALAAGDQDAVNSLFSQQQNTRSIPTPVGDPTFIRG